MSRGQEEATCQMACPLCVRTPQIETGPLCDNYIPPGSSDYLPECSHLHYPEKGEPISTGLTIHYNATFGISKADEANRTQCKWQPF